MRYRVISIEKAINELREYEEEGTYRPWSHKKTDNWQLDEIPIPRMTYLLSKQGLINKIQKRGEELGSTILFSNEKKVEKYHNGMLKGIYLFQKV
jgi:hypothetical protein